METFSQRILVGVKTSVSRTLLASLSLYQICLSPLLGNRCRFYPSCSEYAKQALRTHPLPNALWFISKRLLRCQPYSTGGVDPVPENKEI